MQTDNKQIYKELAVEKGKSEQMYKDLGNFVWAETYHMIRNPQSLITKLKGIGSWHLRRKRMRILVEDFPMGDKVRADFITDQQYEEWAWRKNLRITFAERLKDYIRYVTIRDEIRRQRRQ